MGYDGALFLAMWLLENRPCVQDGLVLELGCGTACVGLVAASLGAEVVCTDRSDTALKLAERGAKRNGLHNMHFHQWDWSNPMPPHCKRCKVILAADVVYIDEASARALLKALDEAAADDCTA